MSDHILHEFFTAQASETRRRKDRFELLMLSVSLGFGFIGAGTLLYLFN